MQVRYVAAGVIVLVGIFNYVGVARAAVVMNLATRQGRAAVEGRPLDGAELSEYLTLATRIWAGETYWLLAPYKLRDPGAILTYEGEETQGGAIYDRMHLRFENVGGRRDTGRQQDGCHRANQGLRQSAPHKTS